MTLQQNYPIKPDIPGIHYRGFEGDTDYPKMLAIITACKKADQDDGSETLEDLKNNYEHLNNCDPYQDMLFVEIKGEAIAYTRVFWFEDAKTHELIYYNLFKLSPLWRDQGVEDTILKWNETRIKQIAQNHTQNVPHFFEISCNEKEISKVAFLKKNGYQAVRYGFLNEKASGCHPNR